jgi:hypothetical protein
VGFALVARPEPVRDRLARAWADGAPSHSCLWESLPQRVEETVHFIDTGAEPHQRLGDPIVADVVLASSQPARLSGLCNFLQLSDLALQNLVE